MKLTAKQHRLSRPSWRLFIAAGIIGVASIASAEDIGKKACLPDAKLLCAHEMHLLSRSRVQECLIKNIDKTSAFCHTTMLKLKAQHQADTSQAKN